MRARDFYDLTWREWMAAIDGHNASMGAERKIPATSSDLDGLEQWAGPSRSIR